MKELRETVIVDAIRTPIGKRNSAYAHTRPDELASHVLKEITKRTKSFSLQEGNDFFLVHYPATKDLPDNGFLIF